MPSQKHVVVVGAGIIGASLAWHLARAGAQVTIVEAGAAGGVATPNSFAWINASWGNPEPYFRLRTRSMREWSRLKGEVPALPLDWCGSLCWDLPHEELQAYATQHAAWGYDIRPVHRSEVLRLEPNLATPPDFALHVAEEGAVEPTAAALALLAEAQRLGAILVRDRTVQALRTEGDRIVGLDTAEGLMQADEVLVAAGVGSAALLAEAGIALPMTTPPGLLVHSTPHPRLLNGLVMSEAAHLRQTAEGRIVAGTDFTGTDPGNDPDGAAASLFAEAKSMLAGADDLELEFFTVGYRPTPADGFPVVGRVAGRAGLYVAVLHSGITLAPAVGLFGSDEILSGRRDPLLQPYGFERFG